MQNKRFTCIGFSDTGKVREHNEDSIVADPENQIFIIADGVGGNLAGEVASKFVTDHLHETLRARTKAVTRDGLVSILKDINSGLQKLANENTEYKGMGSTLVFIINRDAKPFIGNVGDSRAYLFRNGKLTQVTKDHSVVQQLVDLQKISPQAAFDHPLKHLITMAMGNETIEPDVSGLEVNDHDVFLLCSDGLTDMVADNEIENLLIQYLSAQERLDALKDKALENGGKDNISIILLENQML